MQELILSAGNYLYGAFQNILTKLVVAIIILLVGFILGRMAGKILLRVLKEIEFNAIIEKTTGLKISVAEIISRSVTYLIYFIFIIAALERLSISSVAFNLLAGGVIVVIIISIFLGIKDFIPNMIAGIYIAQKRIIKKGDKVKIDGIKGKVTDIKLTNTKIETPKGDILFIPNSTLIKNKIIKIKN